LQNICRKKNCQNYWSRSGSKHENFSENSYMYRNIYVINNRKYTATWISSHNRLRQSEKEGMIFSLSLAFARRADLAAVLSDNSRVRKQSQRTDRFRYDKREITCFTEFSHCITSVILSVLYLCYCESVILCVNRTMGLHYVKSLSVARLSRRKAWVRR
jgi:hypothetical protein